MKKLSMFVLTAFAATAVATQAEAQVRPFSIGIAGGPSIPQGDLADEAGTGFHVQGSLGFNVPLLPVGLRADALWQEFPDESDGWFRQMGGIVNAVASLPLPLARPYALGGIGLLNTSAPDAIHLGHAHDGEDRTDMAWNVGAGVQFGFVGMSGFLEAKYQDAGEGHRAIPITFGIMF